MVKCSLCQKECEEWNQYRDMDGVVIRFCKECNAKITKKSTIQVIEGVLEEKKEEVKSLGSARHPGVSEEASQ